jgi:ubiquitin-activating enzyme E1 C
MDIVALHACFQVHSSDDYLVSQGNARIIYPGITACIDCTLDLFPPQINFPLCTLAHTPRLPEHCIEFVRILLWPKESPFGEDTPIDGDDPAHIAWIHERALDRAAKFGIGGVTLRLTQGVVKRIIPAVASTNAIVAAVCAMETFKVATSCANPLQNYLVFNQADGIYTYAYEAERNEDCLACGRKSHYPLALRASDKLQDVIDLLQQRAAYQMKSPGLTTTVNGKNRTLYMSSVSSIEAATRANLKKTLSELGLATGSQLVVADATSPMPLIFRLTITE